jgi:transcriptional regulator with XRE-family HTH domain
MTRRARVTPKQAGLATGMNRRVLGLRRAEVAMLADVSIEYYSRLERGSLAGVSDSVLEAIARALQLDEAERSHLFDLPGQRAAGHPYAGAPGERRRCARACRRHSMRSPRAPRWCVTTGWTSSVRTCSAGRSSIVCTR